MKHWQEHHPPGVPNPATAKTQDNTMNAVAADASQGESLAPLALERDGAGFAEWMGSVMDEFMRDSLR